MAGISFTTSAVVIDGQVANFDDLYRASVNAKNTMVTKLSSAYVIDGNIILKNGATLQDGSKTVTINGEYFQIPYGCQLLLGTKYSSTLTGNGCIINMPNVIPEFGFGGLDPADSGNVMLYGCTINIYSYWSFFRGDNYVDIINCNIDGYGKVSGGNSAVRNCVFKRAHGKYGTLLYKGSIKEYVNNTVLSVETCITSDQLPDLNNMFVIDQYSGNGNIDIFYGEYYGYSDFLHVLDITLNKPIILYGTNVTNGYNLNRGDANKNDFYHKFKFKPRLQNTDGVILKSIPITITNRLGEIEYSGMTDANGYVDRWLTYYRDLADPTSGEVLTPHTVKITYGGEEISSTIVVDRNMDDFPLILFTNGGGSNAPIDTAKLEEFIKLTVDNAVTTITKGINDVDTDIHGLAQSLGKQLTATTVTIVRGSTKVMC